MLEEYFLLVKRIEGLSLSISDYWELDTFTTQKLLSMELDINKQEQESYDRINKKNNYVEQPDGNSDEMNDIMDMMSDNSED